jgi:hypothetical protein
MITDAFTRLSDAQDLDSAGTAGVLSTNYIDTADRAGRSGASMFGIKERAGGFADGGIKAAFTITDTITLASADPDATFRFQLITLPQTSLATISATHSGGYLTTPVFLPNGTVVTSNAANGLAADTHYFVYRDENDPTKARFKVSTTPDVGGDDPITGNVTLTLVPQIIADSGEIPLARLREQANTSAQDGGRPADQVLINSNPLPSSQMAPLQRYLFARYIPSAALHSSNGGKVTCDVGISVPDNRGVYYAVGSEIK